MLAFPQRSSLSLHTTSSLIPGLMAAPTSARWPYPNRIWANANAHTDLWLSLLSSLQLDPVACLSGAICTDFLDEQWSHFSPSLDDLYAIYGLEIQKIQLWRPLREHLHEQLGAGRMLILEVAKPWLLNLNLVVEKDYPSSQRLLIAMNALDENQDTCGYFYGQNYLHLTGEAYRRFITGLSGAVSNTQPNPWPQSAHVVSIHGWVQRPQQTLEQQSWQLLERVLDRIPAHSPVERWQHRYTQDAARYMQADQALFDAWTAANVQQFGASFELASWYLLWAANTGRGSPQHMVQAADTFRQLSVLAKALQLKSERAYQLGQLLDAADMLERMARHWHKGMELLRQSVPSHGLRSDHPSTH